MKRKTGTHQYSPTRERSRRRDGGRRTSILFVQGAGEGAHAADAKLVTSLRTELGSGYEIRYPRMPDEDAPDDAKWKRRLAKEMLEMRDGSILVGHSAGAATLLRFLAAGKIDLRIAGIFLIAAPFCGEGGWAIEGFQLPPDLGEKLPSEGPVFLYHGRDDETVRFAHLRLYANALPKAFVRPLDGRNHQLNNDLSEVAADIRHLGEHFIMADSISRRFG